MFYFIDKCNKENEINHNTSQSMQDAELPDVTVETIPDFDLQSIPQNPWEF